MKREILTVYAVDVHGDRFRVAGYDRETALRVVNDETVRHITHAAELIAVDRAGDIVARTEITPPLRVCERCLCAIESREGYQHARRVYVDEDDERESRCEWCEECGFDTLYEI